MPVPTTQKQQHSRRWTDFDLIIMYCVEVTDDGAAHPRNKYAYVNYNVKFTGLN